MIQYITSQEKFKPSGILYWVIWQAIADILDEHAGHSYSLAVQAKRVLGLLAL